MKKSVLYILLASIVFVAGCTNIFAGDNTATAGRGVTASFEPGQPPLREIFDGQEFQVAVNLENNGLANVDGEICVSDSLGALFGGIENSRDCQTFNLAGRNTVITNQFTDYRRTIYFPGLGGGYQYRNIPQRGQGDEITTKIKAEISYRYSTLVAPQICISRTSRGCRLTETLSGSSLGVDVNSGPVTVTSIEKTMFPGPNGVGLNLKIKVENVGGGIASGSSVNEFGQDDRKERIDFDINYLGTGAEFNCVPSASGQLTLNSGEATIACSANLFIEEEILENPLEIELRYNYLTELKTGNIRLKSSLV